jgi:hypothetical protein
MSQLPLSKRIPTPESESGKLKATFVLSREARAYLHHLDVNNLLENKSAFIDKLILLHQQDGLYTPKITHLRQEFLNRLGIDPDAYIEKILTRRLTTFKKNCERLVSRHIGTYKTAIGGAYLRIDAAFHSLINEDEPLDPSLRRGITFRLLQQKTGCNATSIRRWLVANQRGLTVYHKENGITSPGLRNSYLGSLKRKAALIETHNQKE